MDNTPSSPAPAFTPIDDAPESLRGRTALITGAGRGLGAAIAEVLGEAGVHVVLADLDGERARRQAQALTLRDIEAFPLALDVREPAQCEQAVRETRARYGRLDILVNNAAIDVTAPLLALQIDDWQRILSTNLYAPLVLCKHAAAAMVEQGGGGHLINIASTAAKRAWPNACAYHATKWGLLGLSYALHAELRTQGIRVSAVVAGGMSTPFLLDRFPDIDRSRLQDPLSVAKAVRFALQQPEGSCIPEILVLPTHESSWP